MQFLVERHSVYSLSCFMRKQSNHICLQIIKTSLESKEHDSKNAKNGPCSKQTKFTAEYTCICRLQTSTDYISFFPISLQFENMHIRQTLTLNVIFERNVMT
jgi:hypothetical protein